MSLEHSPARQKRAAPAQDETVEEHVAETLADDLLLGAEAIAFFLYGKTGPKEVRDVYRNVFQISLFKHGNTLAAFKSVIRADLAQAQQRAREERAERAEEARKKTAKAQAVTKPRRRLDQRIAGEPEKDVKGAV